MNNWNEVDIDMFKYIFNMYWNNDPSTIDNVLEVQNLLAIKSNCSDVRVFFGHRINIDDFEEYNKDSIQVIKMLGELFGIDIRKELNPISMCIVCDGPKIVPLGGTEMHYKMISRCFDVSEEQNDGPSVTKHITSSPIILWYSKTASGDYIIGDKDTKTKKYIRIRGWKFSEWKNMIQEYCDNYFLGDVLQMDEDISKNRLLLQGEKSL